MALGVTFLDPACQTIGHIGREGADWQRHAHEGAVEIGTGWGPACKLVVRFHAMISQIEPLMPAANPRVFHVDPQIVAREGLALALAEAQAAVRVTGEATTVTEALAAISPIPEGVIVTELDVPEGGGLELIRGIRARKIDQPILIFSYCRDDVYAPRALRAGANGFLRKEARLEEFLIAVRRVLDGELHFSNRTSTRILGKAARPESREVAPVERLTNRELRVFRLMGSGWDVREIGDDLQVSPGTVRSHRTNIMRKLEVPNSLALLQESVKWRAQEGVPHPDVLSGLPAPAPMQSPDSP